ncbi:MAG TPA: hypothetical protein PKZ42_14950 [Syntrophales bacterium]|nr:hypothetical protein [Syntrophales bacterium]
MKKVTLVLSILIFLTFCIGTYSFAGPINRLHYAKHPTTLQDAKDVYGEPIHSQALADGTQKVVFSSIKSGIDLGYPFFIVKDGRIIDSGITVEYDESAQQQEIDTLKSQLKAIEMRMKELEKKSGN